MEKEYYDPEYDRIVPESVIRFQYEHCYHIGDGTYEKFKAENFEEIKRDKNGSVTNTPLIGYVYPESKP